ncbi:MAG TPA: nuclease-related domain-containing protein [Anaerolineales bacterium]|nr:nuclease-related domain-containing protein [Anaerolineales bacterium]
MKVIIDHEKLRRRAVASHAASLGGMLTMLGGVVLPLLDQSLATLAAVLLFLGFAAATTGIYFANRWVRKPRPEEVLDQALKGLDDRHRLYHYLPGGPPHLLLSPSGLVLLETRSGEGYFVFQNGRWRQKITLGKALRFFVEEPLGDPIAEAHNAAERLHAVLAAKMEGGDQIRVSPVVVFTHPAAILQVKGAAIPVCQPKQLRGLLPKSRQPLSASIHEGMQTLLDSGKPF